MSKSNRKTVLSWQGNLDKKKTRVLIVGINGFSGRHLCDLLQNLSHLRIFGTYLHRPPDKKNTVCLSGIEMIKADVNQPSDVERVIERTMPDFIFHFASYVTVAKAFVDSLRLFETNVVGTAVLLEAVRKISPASKILLPGSSEEYGPVAGEKLPIRESYSLQPVNAYGLSKKFEEEVGFYYFKTFGMHIYFTRTFHYTGPGQPDNFVCSSFARQIAGLKGGKQREITVGNLKARRDFTDIRDVVSAYWKIIRQGKPGYAYNVCSGSSVSIEEIINRLIDLSGGEVRVKIDPDKFRRLDIPEVVGSNRRLKSLGWKPKHTLSGSLCELLKGWQDAT